MLNHLSEFHKNFLNIAASLGITATVANASYWVTIIAGTLSAIWSLIMLIEWVGNTKFFKRLRGKA
jgi:hypothetical protein